MSTLISIYDAVPGPVLVVLYVWGLCYLLREPINSFTSFKARQWTEENERDDRAKEIERLESELKLKRLRKEAKEV